jgi:hypothetical protein
VQWHPELRDWRDADGDITAPHISVVLRSLHRQFNTMYGIVFDCSERFLGEFEKIDSEVY